MFLLNGCSKTKSFSQVQISKSFQRGKLTSWSFPMLKKTWKENTQLYWDMCSAVHFYMLSVSILPACVFHAFNLSTCLICRILFSALRVTKPMKDIEIPETQVATFECEVSHFNVPSTWLKNGVEIEMSEKFRIVVQGKLHQLKIMNTSRDDTAEYTFVCGNDRVSATLTVSRKFSHISKQVFLFPVIWQNSVRF